MKGNTMRRPTVEDADGNDFSNILKREGAYATPLIHSFPQTIPLFSLPAPA